MNGCLTAHSSGVQIANDRTAEHTIGLGMLRAGLARRCTMTIGKALIAAGVLALAAPTTKALAHDDYGYDGGYYGRGSHSQFHDELADAHRRAHEEGFYSRDEHRAFHRALRYLHREYHEDHPSYYGNGYYRYRSW